MYGRKMLGHLPSAPYKKDPLTFFCKTFHISLNVEREWVGGEEVYIHLQISAATSAHHVEIKRKKNRKQTKQTSRLLFDICNHGDRKR